MEFLVVGRYTEPGALLPAEQLVPVVKERVIPSLEKWADWEAEGQVKAGGIFAGARVGACVMQADSGEEIGQLLTSLPFWHDCTWEVTPLQSFRSAAERETRLLEQVETIAQQ